MRRRTAYPLILLAATGVWSVVTALASSPQNPYEYLNELVVEENYVLGTVWEDSDVKHIEKLSDADKTLFIRMLEAFDQPETSRFDRQIFLGQAAQIVSNKNCRSDAKSCTYSVYLNRTLSPNLSHGDLRLVSLKSKALRQDITIHTLGNRIEYGKRYLESRQLRYMLTERGWVLKSSELTEQAPLSKLSSLPFNASKVSGLNYYPASAPWDAFWNVFPRDEISTDLDVIKDLGANAVRIFIQHDYFSDLETQEDGLAKLNLFLEMCADRDIKVIVTLFDLRADYRFQNWSRDTIHVMTILKEIADHPALLAVDLKNQADLDFDKAGKANVLAWADAMIAAVRSNYPHIPLTIGWSDSKNAQFLAEYLNIVSFHDYHDPDNLSERLKDVQNRVGSKPVFVTEIGHSRWGLTGEKTERQAIQLSAQLEQLHNADGVFVWTLNDFNEIGSNVVGHRPWRKAQQKSYGIVKEDGQWREAAKKFHTFNSEFVTPKTGD